jgi:hypothetical protein
MDSRETAKDGPSMVSPVERLSKLVVMMISSRSPYIGRMVWPRPEQMTSPF